jgi:hypothetical protein
MWMGPGSQFVPGQIATTNLRLRVPNVPIGAQAWEVTPGGVRALEVKRVVGGTEVTIPDFGLTTAIVFTGDHGPDGLEVYFQREVRRRARLAAQWTKELAEEELKKVTQVEEALAKQGHQTDYAKAWLKDAGEKLAEAKRLWEGATGHETYAHDRDAYAQAQLCLRSLRRVTRSEWEAAVKNLDVPSASVYALSYYTLPRHWEMVDRYKAMRRADNVLPDGDFETPPNQQAAAWTVQVADSLDAVIPSAKRVTEGPHGGKQCLKLEVKPKDPQRCPAVLERTFLAIHSPDVHLAPGTDVIVSGWVRIPKGIGASADGAMLYDSAGDVPLAVRLVAPHEKWKKFTLYRKVPSSGKLHVTLALTGVGIAYFDDIRIEPLLPKADTAEAPAAPMAAR